MSDSITDRYSLDHVPVICEHGAFPASKSNADSSLTCSFVRRNHQERVISGQRPGEPVENRGGENVRAQIKPAGVAGDNPQALFPRMILALEEWTARRHSERHRQLRRPARSARGRSPRVSGTAIVRVTRHGLRQTQPRDAAFYPLEWIVIDPIFRTDG